MKLLADENIQKIPFAMLISLDKHLFISWDKIEKVKKQKSVAAAVLPIGDVIALYCPVWEIELSLFTIVPKNGAKVNN